MKEGMFLTKCLDGLKKLPDDSIDLIIANPFIHGVGIYTDFGNGIPFKIITSGTPLGFKEITTHFKKYRSSLFIYILEIFGNVSRITK